MKTLAFDTATMEATCAVVEDGKKLAQSAINSTLSHSETLIGMIEGMLNGLDLKIADMDLIATGTGPGSFTGLRISVVLAKILSRASNIPLVGVSTLEALASQAAEGEEIIPVLDARRNRVYCSRFRRGAGGRLLRISEDNARSVEAVAEAASEGAVLLGDGLLSYRDDFAAARPDFVLYPDPLGKVRAEYIAYLAEARYREKGPDNPYALEPNYLRPSQAMREYRRKHGQSDDATSE